MNKADLVETLARRYGGDRGAASLALEAVLDSIAGELSAGGIVSVAGFGSFQTVPRSPRTIRDPRTGRTRKVTAAPVPQFRPAAELRAIAAGTKKPAQPAERVVAHKTARAAARRLVRDNQAAELTRHITTFDPRNPADYLFAADPGSPEAKQLAAAASAAPPISWPAATRALVPTPAQQDPKPTPTAPLPSADVLVVTYSPAEAHALAEVFTPGWSTPRWYPYRSGWRRLKQHVGGGRNVPSLRHDQAGRWAAAQVGPASVVLVKSDLHPATDGGTVPLVALWQQMIEQVQPRLIITTGAATAGTRDLVVGDVVVSRHVDLADPTSSWPTGGYTSPASLRGTRINTVQTKLLSTTTPLLPTAGRAPRIWTDTPAHPATVLSATLFGADVDLEPHRSDPAAKLVVDHVDAALTLAQGKVSGPPPWMSVRAVTALQATQSAERASAAASHERAAFAACLGSALTCWALVSTPT